MKTMPFCSSMCSACVLISSSLTSLAASSSTSNFKASGILSLRVWRFCCPIWPNMPRNCSVISSMPGGAHDLQLRRRLRQVNFNFPVCQLALAQFLAKSLARGTLGFHVLHDTKIAPRGRNQDVENPIFGRVFGACAHFFHLSDASLLDGNIGQIADDGVNILANVADLGELGGLDLDERRIGEPRQTPRDFGFTHTSRANHQSVLGSNFCTQAGLDLLAPPAIAQCNGHRPLGLLLANNVFIKFKNNFLRSHGFSNQLRTELAHCM